jgi:glycosyltransferase involved in cell wall biosynthesis
MVGAISLGYPGTCYGMVRVSHGLPLDEFGISYRRVQRLPWHRLPGAPQYWSNRYEFFPRPAVDAVHLFNGICTSRIPWVSSIELEYPRYFGRVSTKSRDQAFECMAREDCRLLLPLSEAARTHLLSRVPERHVEAITSKTKVFRGGVRIPTASLQARRDHLEHDGGPLWVGFVGKAFWHKGGPAVLEAIERMRLGGADLRLFLVSEMKSNSHVANPTSEEVGRILAKIACTNWIEHHHSLPNEDVLARLAICDIVAFPSFDESLGWVAIEALGLGVPVVASTTFAMPEIIQHAVEGFLIEIPLNEDRRWTGIVDLNPSPRPSYADTHQVIVEGCVRAFENLVSDRPLRKRMGDAGLRKFKEHFSEDVACGRLAALLRQSLA